MNTKNVRCLLFVVVIVLLSLLVACTTDQLATKEKKPKGPLTAEERSRREQEARVLESSWYESSDYHTQRDSEGGIDVGE
jgi:major membrane immunogen (membrane-anchored lipoprotein)